MDIDDRTLEFLNDVVGGYTGIRYGCTVKNSVGSLGDQVVFNVCFRGIPRNLSRF